MSPKGAAYSNLIFSETNFRSRCFFGGRGVSEPKHAPPFTNKARYRSAIVSCQQQEDSKRPYLTSLPMPRYEVSDEQIAANRQRQMDYWKVHVECGAAAADVGA